MSLEPTPEFLADIEVRSDDVILTSFPKSGTTWMKEILSLVQNGGNVDAIKDVSIDQSVPPMEFLASKNPLKDKVLQGLGLTPDFNIANMESPRLMQTHFHYKWLPRQIDEKKAKIIYIARNPKDVAVSNYNFQQTFAEGVDKIKKYKNFSEFLKEQFVDYDGEQTFTINYTRCCWHNHVLSFWEKRHKQNMLFLKYEDLQKDARAAVRTIAEFMGVVLEDKILDTIVDHTSFKNMKKNPRTLRTKFCSERLKLDDAETRSPFVRKGKVGGWKEYFTVADNEIFDAKYEEWMKDSDLEMDFTLD